MPLSRILSCDFRHSRSKNARSRRSQAVPVPRPVNGVSVQSGDYNNKQSNMGNLHSSEMPLVFNSHPPNSQDLSPSELYYQNLDQSPKDVTLAHEEYYTSSGEKKDPLQNGIGVLSIPALESPNRRQKADRIRPEQIENDELKNKIQDLEAKVSQYSQKIARMQEDGDNLMARRTKESEEFRASCEHTIGEFKKQIEELQEEKDVLGKTLQGNHEQLTEIQRLIEGHKDEKSVLEKTLQGKNEKLVEIETQIEGLRDEKSVLEKTLQGRDEQLAITEVQIQGIKNEKIMLERVLQEKDKQLVEFDKHIVRMSNERSETNRDDRYFETNFSSLFGGMQSWVVKFYITADVDDEVVSNLPEAMKFSLMRRLGKDWIALLKTHTMEVMQGFVVDEVRRSLFLPMLFGLVEDIVGVFKMVEKSTADREEFTKWHLSTISLLLKRPEFQPALAQKLDTLATFIVDSLKPLLASSPIPYKPGPRTRQLRALLQKAADLAIEFQQESSTFSFPEFEPGMNCLAIKMMDFQGLRDEKKLEGEGEKVVMTVFPGMVRTGPFGVVVGSENGNQEVIILKAKVLATDLNGDEHVNGIQEEKEEIDQESHE